MIVKWTTSKPLIARITRNIRNVDYEFLADLPDWIDEAIKKLETSYQLTLCDTLVDIHFHLAQVPCGAEGIAAVTYKGMRLLAGDNIGSMRQAPTYPGETIFQSVLNIPGGITDLDETDINNWPFYLNTVEALEQAPICQGQSYRMKYDKIETSIESGKLKVYFWSYPKDAEGLPMVVANDNYQTCIYWYCRMMMIGAGYEDLVFTYEKCERDFEKYLRIAINEITYPTIDEKKRTIMNTTGLIPHLYDWETFGAGGQEMTFNDDLT